VIVLVCLIGVGLLSYGPLLLILPTSPGRPWLGRDTSRRGADPETPAHIGAAPVGLQRPRALPAERRRPRPALHAGRRLPGRVHRLGSSTRGPAGPAALRPTRSTSRTARRTAGRRWSGRLRARSGTPTSNLYAWDEEGNHLDGSHPAAAAGRDRRARRGRWRTSSSYSASPTPTRPARLIHCWRRGRPRRRLRTTLTPAGRRVRRLAAPGFRSPSWRRLIWRIGSPSANPHLLVTGGPSTGKSTAVRSLLRPGPGPRPPGRGDGHRTRAPSTGLLSRPGERAADQPSSTADSLDLLDWFGLEVERRSEGAVHAVHAGPLRLGTRRRTRRLTGRLRPRGGRSPPCACCKMER